MFLLALLLAESFSARAATQPNAWQIADVSNTAGSGALNYFTNLTTAQRTAATNDGWRFTVVSRLVEGSGGVGPAQFMTYGNGIRRFVVGWDTNAAGRLTATTFGSPNTTNVLTATASAATNVYHHHDLVYDPLTQQATYLFDGVSIQTWSGLNPDANLNGTPQWGSGSSSGRGRMNYHHVQFAINGLGAVAEYDAGLSNAPVIAPNPQTQGWNTNLPVVVMAVTNAPVSPDAAPLPTIQATYATGDEVPVTCDGFRATGYTVNFTLNYAPVPGTELMVVRNTGLGFIQGTFDNLTNGQPVTLSYGGINYNFVANYYGGSGNDLVLAWADVRPFAWGRNDTGQLGDGSGANRSNAVPVDRSGVLSNKTVVAMAAGNGHSLALCSDGTLAAWGRNDYGQLGNGTNTGSSNAVLVSRTGVLSNKTVVAIAVGGLHNLALCSDGTLAAWGYNGNGQLGNGSTGNANLPVAVSTNMGALSNKTVVAITAGELHSLALCSDGTLAAWGRNNEGQLGDGSSVVQTTVPVAVSTNTGALVNKRVVAMATGFGHSLALCSDGTVAAWGYNLRGQLGNGSSVTQTNVPVAVSTNTGALSNKLVVAITAGYLHNLALCSDGTVAVWGRNDLGQLGNGSTMDTNRPVAVITNTGALSNKTVVAMSAGGYHSLALCSDGTVAAWGLNNVGQLGNGSLVNTNRPVAVSMTSLAAGEPFSYVASGPIAGHTLALVAASPATAPVITCPGNLMTNAANGTDTLAASWTVATNGVPAPVVTCVPPSGSLFSVGSTLVTCAASNIAGTNLCTFTVTVCATNIVVTSAANSGPGSLRLAISNACPGGTITFAPALNGQTIVLTSGELIINKNLTILGPGATNLAISGNGNSRVFSIDSGVTSLLAGLTITNGNGVGFLSSGQGGGIFNAATLTVSNCTLSGNVSSSGGHGGGIYNFTTLTVLNSTVSGNSAVSFGGGLFNAPGGTLMVGNCTLSGNSAAFGGGGIASANPCTLTLWNSTLSGNSGNGGGLSAQGTDWLTNCIVAGNFFGATPSDISGPVDGAAFNLIGSAGSAGGITHGVNGNIVGNSGSGTRAITSILDTNLAFNGGFTRTHALVPGSPAFNAGLNNGAAGLTYDQRGQGFSRIVASTVDIGAFEVQPTVPMITCPTDLVVSNTPGQCYATNVAFTTPGASGLPAPSVICRLTNTVITSPGNFAVGTNVVICTATNVAGTNTCSFTVTVNDVEAPSLTCPANLVLNTDAGLCSKTNVTFIASATDNCPGVTVGCIPPSGSTFAKGVTSVTCTATDAAGNTNACTFTVTVNDAQAPAITCPGNLVRVTDSGMCSKTNVAFTASATDNCPGVTVACVPPSGSTFVKGVTIVNCTATDAAGNTNACTFTVTVNDAQLPTITCPANISLRLPPGSNAMPVSFAASATDNCGVVSSNCVPPSGSFFSFGTTLVTCQAFDAAGNSNGCTFAVQVMLTNNTLEAIYFTGEEVPLAVNGFTATGYTVNFTLNYAPVPGTALMVVRNNGLGFIQGTFDNLTNGQPVTLSYGGNNYRFVANYYGGSGNDLVLAWADVRPFAWGNNPYGQLGDGSGANRSNAVPVNRSGVLSNKTVVAMAAGAAHSLALCSDGTLAAWGGNSSGQLGDGTTVGRSNAVAVNRAGVLSNKTVVAIAAGSDHSLALCSDGTVAAWGVNDYGQLGDGSTSNRFNPVAVSRAIGASFLSNKTVVAISAGARHSLAICSDGKLASWGANYYGQLGAGSVPHQSNAVPVIMTGVLTNKTVTAIAGGYEHSLALCSDGTLAAWGANYSALLGNGTSVSFTNRPARVNSTTSALSNKTAVAIAAGVYHNLVLCSDGTVAAWGGNPNGQVGSNSGLLVHTNAVLVDASGVLSNKTAVAIAAGSDHSLAFCSDGTVAAWGENSYGQLGNGSTTGSSNAVVVSTTSLAAGERFSYIASGAFARHTVAMVAAPQAIAPVITCPGNLSANVVHGTDTVPVTWAAPTATGYPAPMVICVPSSGSSFGVGSTLVTCTATNVAGTNICSFTVTVCATNIVVTSAANSGAGSLRVAISNACPGGTITFAPTLNGLSIVLTSGELVIRTNLSILGPGAPNLAISGNGNSRVFSINSNVFCTLAGLTLTNGNGFGAALSGYGGGVLNQGSLTVSNSSLSRNSADFGGGIFNNAGTLTLQNTTVSGNSALQNSGGVGTFQTALDVQNCTFSDNSAGVNGGAFFNNNGTLTLRNSTITGNRAASGGGLNAAGIERITNCVVAGNLSGTAPSDIVGNVDSAAFNLIGSTNGVVGITNGVSGNIVGNAGGGTIPITSILDTNLLFNGGTTRTHALVPGSPAINAGLNSGAAGLTYDQRGPGFPRIFAGTVDLGAYELQAALPQLTCPGDLTTTNTPGQCLVTNVTFVVTSDSPVTCLPPSGSSFNVGTNMVSCTATNVAGTNACSFKILVRDAEEPVFNCLDLAANTPPGFTTVAVSFSPQAIDNCSGPITPVCTPPSGTSFAVGTNVVLCSAVDSAGNSNACSFNVTVTAVPAFVASDAGLAGGLTGVSDGALAWADFDGDGRPDLFLSGQTVNQFTRISRLYRNSGGTNLVAVTVNPALPGLHFNTVAWADYDLDGDVDVLLSGDQGAPFTQLYRNDGGGVFTAVPTTLPALASSAAAWGDFDRDGRPDLLLCGSPDGATPLTRLYRNCGNGQFVAVNASLPDVVLGAVAWADFDRDGILDLALMGFDGVQDVAGIYRGNGNGTFTEVGGLGYGFEAGAVAWGDFNNDGFPDVVFTGGSGTVARTMLYRNEPDGSGGRRFIPVANPRLPDLKESTVAWGDFNNDGRLDLVIGGATGLLAPSRQAGIYLNNGAEEFNILPAGVPAVERARVACADFNGDGRLDMIIAGYTGTNRLTRLLLNNTTVSNTPPTAPTGLSASLTTQGVTLGWSGASDAQTPAGGLGYNVRITGPNGQPFVVSPAALAGGTRLLASAGNAGQTNRWPLGNLALPTGVYTWSVQAIDSAFAGSVFSTNGTFYIQQPLFTGVGMLGNGGYRMQFTGSNLTYHVEATTNIVDCGMSVWTRLGVATTNAPGQFEFIDTQASDQPARIYRLVWP